MRKPREIRLDDLKTLAVACHGDIKWPESEGGWATATLNGHDYKAWIGPVPTVRAEES